MDHTETLTATAVERPDDEPAWVYFHAPERVLFQRGVAYVELGRHGAAVELFDAARARLPAGYRRDHGRYAANLAVAAALDGQVDRATAAARDALAGVVETGSAHTVADLRRMRRALDRWATPRPSPSSMPHLPRSALADAPDLPAAVFRLDVTHTDTPGGPHTMCPMAVSPHDLAAALTSRLDTVAPEGLRVRATYQPRARHSGSDGRSAARVVSSPCPG